VIAVGLPGSGKTSYFSSLGVHAISSDDVRLLLADDPTDQSIHRQVFATIRYLVRQRISIGRDLTYVDATHLTRKERRPYLEIGRVRESNARCVRRWKIIHAPRNAARFLRGFRDVSRRIPDSR
jgi:predicted kinase